MLALYKRLSSQTLLVHPRLTVVEDQVELPGGEQGDYLWFDQARGAVTVIARNERGELLIEQEYSYLSGVSLYQFPGGGKEVGEEPEAAANREMGEEVGYRANRLTPLGSFLLDHRRSTAFMHVFLGEDLVPHESVTRDKYEVALTWEWLPEAAVDGLVADGKIVNAIFLAAWTLYKSHERKVP